MAKPTIAHFVADVIADGRITIPKKTRDKEAIAEGDQVEVLLVEIIRNTVKETKK